MPIVTGSDSLGTQTNGDVSNSLINSLEGEESFVVLERLTANDPGPLDMSIQSLHSFQPFNSCSFPVFNNLSTSGLTSSRPIANNPNHSQAAPVELLESRFDSNNISVSAEEIQKQLQEVLRENVNLKENLFQTNLAMKQHMSTVRLLQDRASEVQKNHQAKFEETKSLILQLGSEKNELQEANSMVAGELIRAKQEIKELKEATLAFGNEMTQILSENDSLKKQLASVQENMHSLTESSKKVSLQPTAKEVELHELSDQLSRKLEGVERSRRQQEFDIDRLKAQLGRVMQDHIETQRKLALAEEALKIEKEKSSIQLKNDLSSLKYSEKLPKYDKYEEILNQLKISVQEEETRCNSLSSWLTTDPVQFEIAELRRLLSEEQSQSILRKEHLNQALATITDLLSDFHIIAKELELLKADRVAKESHSVAYDELQKKGFTERLDALTAKLVEKEEALAISERHLASLQEAVRLQNAEKKDTEETGALKEQLQGLSKEVNDKEKQLQANNEEIKLLKSEVGRLQTIAETLPLLEEQAKIFKDDFETERKSREGLASEKDRLVGDLDNLVQRNQQLMQELERIQNGQAVENVASAPPANVDTRPERSVSPAPPTPQDGEVVQRLYCPNPNCNKMFTELPPLEHHVIECLGLTD